MMCEDLKSAERDAGEATRLLHLRLPRVSMQSDSKIYVAGHRGLVGSAIRHLTTTFPKIITRTHWNRSNLTTRRYGEFFGAGKTRICVPGGGQGRRASMPTVPIRPNLSTTTSPFKVQLYPCWRYNRTYSKPLDFVKELNSLLKTDGILILSTPDFDKWITRITQIKPEEHLFYFTKSTLRNLLEKESFEILYINNCKCRRYFFFII